MSTSPSSGASELLTPLGSGAVNPFPTSHILSESGFPQQYSGLTDTPRSLACFDPSFPGTTNFGPPHSSMPQPFGHPTEAESQSTGPVFCTQEDFNKQYTIVTQSGKRVCPQINASAEKGFFR